jgi:hypothetical protein
MKFKPRKIDQKRSEDIILERFLKEFSGSAMIFPMRSTSVQRPRVFQGFGVGYDPSLFKYHAIISKKSFINAIKKAIKYEK